MRLFLVLGAVIAQQVCGMDGITYSSPQASQQNKTTIRHCDNCGSCSNLNDINIYNVTRNTLTLTVTDCAYLSILGGRSAVKNCMLKIGFTPNCLECWLDNVMCDRDNCKLACLKCKFGLGCEVEGGLDACLRCDELKCGPAFKKCAGANRRRCGIVSDIARPDEEICQLVGQ